jgi:hypothetical protein
MRKLSCDEAADALGVPHLHCDSCHEDEDECGISLMELTLPDGMEASVCCKMAKVLYAKINQKQKDFPYPGERMTASQNDLLAIAEERKHAQANIAHYVKEIERLKKALRVYHYDSRELGGQTEYQSVATKALRK